MPGKDGTRHTHTVTEAPPAPASLLSPQGMSPHPGKEGRHLPTAQPGTAAFSSTHRQHLLVPRAPHRKKKSRCTQAALMDEHKGSHTPWNTLVHPQPPGDVLPERNSLVSKRNVQTATLIQQQTPQGVTSPCPEPQHREGCWGSVPRPGTALL